MYSLGYLVKLYHLLLFENYLINTRMDSTAYLITPDTFVKELFNRGKFLTYQYGVKINGLDTLCVNMGLSDLDVIQVYGQNTSIGSTELLDSIRNVIHNNDVSKSFINFQSVGVSLPSIGIDTLEYTPMYQSAIKLAGKSTRGDFKMTMRSSADLREWKFFRMWCTFTSSHQMVSYQDEYARNIVITTYPETLEDDDKPTPSSITTLIRCYPKSVEGIELKQDASGNEMHTFIVEFEYEAILTDYGQPIKNNNIKWAGGNLGSVQQNLA